MRNSDPARRDPGESRGSGGRQGRAEERPFLSNSSHQRLLAHSQEIKEHGAHQAYELVRSLELEDELEDDHTLGDLATACSPTTRVVLGVLRWLVGCFALFVSTAYVAFGLVLETAGPWYSEERATAQVCQQGSACECPRAASPLRPPLIIVSRIVCRQCWG